MISSDAIDVKNIQGILFDLDGTLTDYEASSAAGLKAAYHTLTTGTPGFKFREFEDAFQKVITLESLETSCGGIKYSALDNRMRRFKKVLRELGCDDEVKLTGMAKAYGQGRSQGAVLFPGVIETLEYLKNKFRLGVITEGAVSTQMTQLDNLSLKKFFSTIVISGATPYHKPAQALYEFAVKKIQFPAKRIVMVGDRIDWDIKPAKAVGMKTIWLSSRKDVVVPPVDDSVIDMMIYQVKDLLDIFEGIGE